MTRNELIAAVALDFIKVHLEQEQEGSLRFCMLGLHPSLVSVIAEAALADTEISASVSVKIPPLFDPDRILPDSSRSEQSMTHWRHCCLPDGKRAVLFAASQEELQRNDKSVEKITKLETDTLRARYEVWIEKVGLTAAYLDDNKQDHLGIALRSADLGHVVRTIETFADFVLAIAEGVIHKSLALQKAIDNALPSLRLPRFAGNFDGIPDKKRTELSEWNKIFLRLHKKVRRFLARETERGEPISREQLSKSLHDMKSQLSEEEWKVIQDFIDADLRPDGWSDEQAALVNLDWRKISGLFEDSVKTASLPLGEQTVKFFDDEFDDQLDEDERSLFFARFPKDPSDDLREFFESHKEHLARDKKLASSWERYIYRNPQTYSDFFVGLIATIDSLRRRTSDEELAGNKLVVSIPKGREKSFWRGKNPRVARYFAFRYRGLGTLLGENIELDFGKLTDFYFPEVDDDLAKVTSKSKEACSIKFEVVFDPEGAGTKLIFYWKMPVDAIATSLPDDLLSVAHLDGAYALLPTADITRQSVSVKGGIQRIALDNVNTIRDVMNTNEGKLVAPNEKDGDRTGAFRSALDGLESVLGTQNTETIRSAFDAFVESNTKAIRDWADQNGPGIASDGFLTQADAYNQLLACLLRCANNDRAREKLWQEMLRFGVANIGAGVPAAIVTPWHPLRLAEIGIKARQVTKLINDVLEANEDDISQADLLFGQVQRELVSNYYPEVCIGFDDGQPILLAAADTAYDYTLAEPPLRRMRSSGDDGLDTEPGLAAKAFSDVSDQYLKLLPHERSNFSIVLYNAESKALPSALASELSNKVEQENELRCDLLLTHEDPKHIRRIYEQQNATVSNESGSVMASEAARNFLSRLRVGLLDTADLRGDDTDRAVDLVALQNVVARNAKLVWKEAPGKRHPILTDHVPARWSRRRPMKSEDMTASVYLACPAQPEVGQNYLNVVQCFLEGDNASSGNMIPAREVNFRDSKIKDLFKQTHQIGEWVVNFDELVDRRLLAHSGVRVIRHIHDRTVDQNIVVSTTAEPKLLHVLLKERLERLDPVIVGDGEKVTHRLIDQANVLSGQVVMRAARYGRYANELLGIVLSMEQIRARSGGSDLPLGWYFLDDFASWFGQPEEQIADIMAIAPRIENGKPILKVAISEAKFVSSRGYKKHAKKSAIQLEETVARIGRVLDPRRKRVDRDIWLHRLGDFMIEGLKPSNLTQMYDWDLHTWSDEVREGRVPIQLAGFSHVFIHDDYENVDAGSDFPLKGMPHCTQQIFDKPQVVGLLRSFAASQAPPTDVTPPSAEGWTDDLVSSSKTSIGTHLTAGSRPLAESIPPSVVPDSVSDDNADIVTKTEETQQVGVGADDELGQVPVAPFPDQFVTTEPVRDEAEISKECLEKWPSYELAKWVSIGRIPGEESDEARAWLDATVKSMQRALRGYEMTAQLVGARLTPNAALLRFRGSDDLTVPKVEKRRQELLTSHAIDVINVLAAPMEVVIMVARPSRTILGLRDLWRQRDLPANAPGTNTSLLLGACESDGELLYLNVGDGFSGQQPHGPHTLIAGETGSGKGVLVQCLLLDICATNAPANARIQMIDPKAGIDFPWLRRMPHLDGNLITERDAAIEALETLVGEMERRNRLLADAGVTKLSHYNRKVVPAKRLPRIWLFHDELADWMMINEYRDAVELNANRLGLKARASGINLVLVTQRPDKDALPVQLRANLTNRLVLKVADKRNSILVLDEPGAERLLGRGHLSAKLSGEGKVILAQVPFASEEEITELAGIIGRAWSGSGSKVR